MKIQFFFIFIAAVFYIGCSTLNQSDEKISLVVENEKFSLSSVGPGEGYGMLSWVQAIDPKDSNSVRQFQQILSVFGREDIIAQTGLTSRKKCSAMMGQVGVLDLVIDAAKDSQIVIVSESHEITRHRAFVEDLAIKLKSLGWSHYGAEAFINPLGHSEDQGYPHEADVRSYPNEPFVRGSAGSYLREAQFGRLVRTVKELGYELVPYEDTLPSGAKRPEDMVDRVNTRDAAQANNIFENVFATNPDAKILLHVGLAHAAELPLISNDGRQIKMLANRIKDLTGIDPITVNQHSCRGNASEIVVSDSEKEKGKFDFFVDHPLDEFIGGRPAWRIARGDSLVAVPKKLLEGSNGWQVIEARHLNDPDEAVPIDSVAVWRQEDIFLSLPPGKYRVRAITFE